jgi:hypothetical protein
VTAPWDRRLLRNTTWEENVRQQSPEAFAAMAYKMTDLKCLTRECLIQKLGNLLGATESMESVLLNRIAPKTLTIQESEQRSQVKELWGSAYTYPEAAGAQSAILNAMLGDTFPKTFCVANASRISSLKPWPKAVILKDLSKTFDVTSAELVSIAFQLMWTLAALIKAFPGFQHNSLGISVKLYTYGARCYRLKNSSDLAYYIPSGFPLPVIVNWSTANCKAISEVPFRVGESDETLDVRDLLNAMLGTISQTMPPKMFKPLVDMKAHCSFSCVPTILLPTCPHSFESKEGECRRCIDSTARQSSFREQSSSCVNANDTIQTTLLVSTFFDDFLEPLKTSQIAIVDSF